MATPSTPERAMPTADNRPVGPHTAGKLNQKCKEAKRHASDQQQRPEAKCRAGAPEGGRGPAQCRQGNGQTVPAKPEHKHMC
jgi:hypothetical protein